MMNDLVVTTEGRILILDRVQTMRACGHDSLGIYLIQNFNICRGQAKENIFASGAAGRVAVALFILPKHGKVDSCRVQNLCEGLCGLLGTRVSCGSAADPP